MLLFTLHEAKNDASFIIYPMKKEIIQKRQVKINKFLFYIVKHTFTVSFSLLPLEGSVDACSFLEGATCVFFLVRATEGEGLSDCESAVLLDLLLDDICRFLLLAVNVDGNTGNN
jgi:hypothetical protein